MDVLFCGPKVPPSAVHENVRTSLSGSLAETNKLAAAFGANVSAVVVQQRSNGAFHWDEAAVYLHLQEHRYPRAAILFGAFEEQLPFSYYYHGSLPVLGFLPKHPDPRVPTGDEGFVARFFSRVVTRENISNVADVIAPYDMVWSVRGFSPVFLDPEGLVERWLSAHCREVAGAIQIRPQSALPIIITPYQGCQREAFDVPGEL